MKSEFRSPAALAGPPGSGQFVCSILPQFFYFTIDRASDPAPPILLAFGGRTHAPRRPPSAWWMGFWGILQVFGGRLRLEPKWIEPQRH